MAKVRVHGRLRKVGNSLALLIPAAAARRGGLRPGLTASAEIEPEGDDACGFLSDVYDGPFARSNEEPKLARA
jgi:hypothetical protein